MRGTDLSVRTRALVMRVLAALLLALLGASPAFAAPAGRLVMSIGIVQVVRNNLPSPGRSGFEIQEGDIVRTGPKGTAQIWLTDGGMVALRERSEYRVDQQSYNAGGSHQGDSASGSLLKGGARVLTGAIAKTNPQAVKVNTRVATIGIRGTGFDLVDCLDQCFGRDGAQAASGLYGTVIEGQITAQNEAGSLLLGKGENFFVARPDIAAMRLLKPTDFMAEPPAVDGGGESTSDAAPIDTPVEAPPGDKDGGVGSFDVQGGVRLNPPQEEFRFQTPGVIYNKSGLGSGLLPSASATNLGLQTAEYNTLTEERNVVNQVGGVQIQVASGAIVAMRQPGNASFPGYVIAGYSATRPEGGADSVMVWGRWADGAALLGRWSAPASSPVPLTLEKNQGFHWIVGDRTSTFPAAGRYTFNLIGATTPTETRAGALGGWKVTGGQLIANLPAGTVSGTLSLFTARSDGTGRFSLDFASVGTVRGGLASTPITTSVLRTSGAINLCTAACTGVGSVQFYGNDPAKPASNAGLTYEFNTGGFYVMGVAAFQR